jgi:uncharacterized alpha/beta hydrolase family protein
MERDFLKNKYSVLVHGYNKNKNDMIVLSNNLEKLNHKCFLVNLPLTFKEIEYSSLIFERKIEIVLEEIGKYKKINLIGHSTGGIIIRQFLANTKLIDNINKCVLIAAPNNGSELADLASKYLFFGTKIYKTLISINSSSVKSIKDIKNDKIKIGAIAGNKNNLLLGNFIKEENDGRVKVNSVFYDGLDDFIILPYGHKKIHYKWDTAKLVDKFIIDGKFK